MARKTLGDYTRSPPPNCPECEVAHRRSMSPLPPGVHHVEIDGHASCLPVYQEITAKGGRLYVSSRWRLPDGTLVESIPDPRR